MTYYQFDGKAYYINLDNLYKFVGELPSKEKVVNTTITQIYSDGIDDDGDDDIFNGGKEIVESKSNVNETMSTVRYDMIKYIFSTLFDPVLSSEGTPININHFYDLSFSQKIAINTLIEYKILMEVETDE